MREVLPGVFHWSAFHPPIRTRVSSYFFAPAGIAIDPKLPEEGLDALPGKPQQIVLTSGLHDRDARAFADAFEIPIRATPQAAERLQGVLELELYEFGDEVAPGATAIEVGKLCPDEGALHLATDGGAIVLADALIHYGGTVGFVPDNLLGDEPETIKAGLTDSLHGLLERDFDSLLFAHGEPLIGGAKAALRQFLAEG